MLTLEAFGRRIRDLRMARDLTQQELADRMFVSRKTIGNWESGSRLPDVIMLTGLARQLGVETYELLDEMYAEDDDAPELLVVEARPTILKSFVQLIGSAVPEAHVRGFDSFSETQRYAESRHPAAAFIDVELHENSGYVLAKLLQRINPRINIVFLARDLTGTDAAWAIHASGCVLMPLTREKIRREIDNFRFPVRGLSGPPAMNPTEKRV